MPTPASRLEQLPVYLLAAIPQKKRQLLARGVDVIDLGAGDADLAPPPAAMAALDRALADPAMHRYGFGLGLPAFRETVAGWMEKRFGLRFDPYTEVVPLIGSKEGITHLALAYLAPGDVAVMPEPGYPAYIGGTALASGEAFRYPLRPRTSFLLELDEVPAEVLKRTKLLYLNYPNNPTAAVAPREYLERIVARCRELDILLVYDNAYSELAFDGYRPPSIFEIEGARAVAIEFHSLSKTYNMTGWRLGWAVARPEIATQLQRVKTFADTGPFMALQAAAIGAIESYDAWVPGNIATFRERRDATVAAFRAAGFACEVPRATMYCWLELPEGVPSAMFTDRLLTEEGVVLMPGSGFGAGGRVRTSELHRAAGADRGGGREGRPRPEQLRRRGGMIQRRPSRRPGGPWLVSLALHVVVGGILAYTVDVPGRLGWREQGRAPAVPAERIGFFSVREGPDEPGRSGGDGRPLVESPAPAPTPAPLVAPREVPTGIPDAPPAPAPAEEPTGGSGEVIGEGGPTAGIRPSLNTPRLYAPPGAPAFVAPRATPPGKPTATEIDREVRRRLGGINDSLAALPPQRAPGDWTVEKGGQKWGVDQKKIYLGPVTLPTALLALLPLNVQGNPTEIERGRALSYQRQDIQYHAQRAVTDEEFKTAVKRIRERKERERRAAREGEPAETENAPVP